MGLGPRLALSYLAVVGLFLALVVVSFPRMMGNPDAPLPIPGRPPPHEQVEVTADRAAAAAAEGFASGGREGLLRAVPGEATVFFRDRRHGPELPEPPPLAWQGDGAVLLLPRKLVIVYRPVRSGGEVVAVVGCRREDIPPGRGHDQAMRGMLESSVLAACVCLLAGFGLSLLLTRPLRRLVRAVSSFGPDSLQQRVPVRGSGELAELTRSFNAMAGRLEETVEGLRAQKER
ncbi:MAG: HAMP domain-containing protein, partial [Candidatus Eremiobacterota bacterium]